MTFESDIRSLRAHGPFAWPTARKNAALFAIAQKLEERQADILSANAKDLSNLPADEPPAFRDRLTLTPARLADMAESLRQVAALPDPVGEVTEARKLSNGLEVRRVRAPLGVILMIFESRPNVALEAFSLAFKSGNAIVLRGGRESGNTVAELYRVMREPFGEEIPFFGIIDYDRAHVAALLARPDLVDVVVPRGGDKLIRYVQENARMPIIKNDRGMCHAFVDDGADLEMALEIVINGKTQRPGVCNSLETVLVHESVAGVFLPRLLAMTKDHGLTFRADARALEILRGDARARAAVDADWDTEHLDLVLNCRVVTDLDEALAHVARHGSRHSEVIVTRAEARARRFQAEVDAAAVYWNASTRFTDGFMLGLGGELGISTQKLHVRGPVGLRELTTPRWLVDGTGQVRT